MSLQVLFVEAGEVIAHRTVTVVDAFAVPRGVNVIKEFDKAATRRFKAAALKTGGRRMGKASADTVEEAPNLAEVAFAESANPLGVVGGSNIEGCIWDEACGIHGRAAGVA